MAEMENTASISFDSDEILCFSADYANVQKLVSARHQVVVMRFYRNLGGHFPFHPPMRAGFSQQVFCSRQLA